MEILNKVAAAVNLKGLDKLLVALDSVLHAGDAYGILRAIGSSYYSPCQFSPELERMFNILNTQSKLHMEQMFRYMPGTRNQFTNLLASMHPLQEQLQEVCKVKVIKLL